MKLKHLLFFFLTICSELISAQAIPRFLQNENDQWVDSLMNKMTIEQKIGQLFIIQAYSNGKHEKTDELIEQINQFQVGGVIFMQGGPIAQAKICNKLQESSAIPLLIAIDGETGLGFRLDSTIKYPIQMALGAITNDSLIYRMGFEIGEQCRRMGIHMNMAPVSDINVTAANPIINYRSFGEDRFQVARKAWLYASGMEDAGVLATAKHFPGHGDTEADSHFDLPVIGKNRNQLDSLELFPFAYLIKNGISCVMTGHLQIPSLEPNPKIPATLSSRIIERVLKKDLGFHGLVITDAMNMKGISNLYSSAESAVKALKAGNDMIEIMPRLDRAISAVKQAVENREISMEEINEKCRKVLMAKKWLDLDKNKLVKTENLVRDLNQNSYLLTKRLLQEQATTVLLNRNDLIPIQRIDTLKMASVVIGSDQITAFQKMLGNYASIDHFSISKNPTDDEITTLINQLKPYNLLIIGINGMSLFPFRQFGISDQQIGITEKLKDKNSIICFFGNPYALPYFPSIKQSESLVVTYQNDQDAQELVAQLIFGAVNANGKLPVNVNVQFTIGSGIDVKSNMRLKYTIPEEVNISSEFLNARIDSLIQLGMSKKAFPGCQVLIAIDGKVIWNKSYGFFTYDNKQPVQNEDLYDLASVTKISGALPAVMKLYDEGKINLDKPFSAYFSEFRKSNKSEITLRDILTHQARLQSFLPLWLEPGNSEKLRKGMFQDHLSEKYQVRVSTNLYASIDLKQQLFKDIAGSPLWNRKEYHYSDLGFSLFPTVTERLTGEDFQEFLNREFFTPLGAITTGYKPYERFPMNQLVPTELDATFRKELLQGYVHDELAASFGGVSGNAGLFSTANDLAKVMQMYLQMGYYGGKLYFNPNTVREFTKVQFPGSSNRRALGFDKPNPGIPGEKNKFPAADASPASYGHSGFTGTFVWNDPENQLLFIFLSNRVNPTRKNLMLTELNIRTEMQQAIYDAIKKGLR